MILLNNLQRNLVSTHRCFSANCYQTLPFFYIPLQLDLVNGDIWTESSPLDMGSSMFIQSWNFADCVTKIWVGISVLWFMTCEFTVCEISEKKKNTFSLRWLAWRCEKLRSKHIVQSFVKLRYFLWNGNFILPENVLWCMCILSWRLKRWKISVNYLL